MDTSVFFNACSTSKEDKFLPLIEEIWEELDNIKKNCKFQNLIVMLTQLWQYDRNDTC